MIIGKDSAIKGFALLGLAVLAILTLIVGITTKSALGVIVGLLSAGLEGYAAFLLYKKWSADFKK